MLFGWLMGLIVNPLIEMIRGFVNDFFVKTLENFFFFERVVGISEDTITNLNIAIFLFASSLLTVKLLHKLFCIYILNIDGDSTVSPIEYFKGYIKGIIVTLTFTVAYGWIYAIAKEILDTLLSSLSGQTIPQSLTGSEATLLFILVYLIFVCVIYIHLLMNGVRLLVLRLGIPFACIGLIDNDNGIYTVFVKKIFQTVATVLVQIFLVQLSFIPISNINPYNGVVMVVSGIAILAYSLKIETDLGEIFMASAGTGAFNKMSSLGRGAMTISGFFKK